MDEEEDDSRRHGYHFESGHDDDDDDVQLALLYLWKSSELNPNVAVLAFERIDHCWNRDYCHPSSCYHDDSNDDDCECRYD